MKLKLKIDSSGLIRIIVGVILTALLNKPFAIFLLSLYFRHTNGGGPLYDSGVVQESRFQIFRGISFAILFFVFVILNLRRLTRREKRLIRIMDKRMKKQQKRIEKRNMRRTKKETKKMNKRMLKQMKKQRKYGDKQDRRMSKKMNRRMKRMSKRDTAMMAGLTGTAVAHAVNAGTETGIQSNYLQVLNTMMDTRSELEESRWLLKSELDDMFPAKKFSELSSLRKDGFPVYAAYDEKKRELSVNLQPPCNTLVVGSTGSGKTTMIVNPTIQILAATAARPSMICLDPKGELFAAHGSMLKSRGYSVVNINLKDPLHSAKWNPLDGIYDKYREYVRAGQEIWERRDPVEESGLHLSAAKGYYSEVWYEFQGTAYPSAGSALAAVNAEREEIFDVVYTELESVISALSPVTEGERSAVEKNAYTLIEAIAFAVLEDAAGVFQEFSFANIKGILTNSCVNGEGIREFFLQREDDSKAKQHAAMLLALSDDALSECIAMAHERLSIFHDESLCRVTSESDISILDISNRPTAIFISSPESSRDRNALASVLFLCICRGLLRIAERSEQMSLPRNVYFIMDEFGNFPEITGLDKMITTGRSRRMFFLLVVQSFAQLNRTYGEQAAGIIKSNCPTKFCLGSNESDTCEEFSMLCGNTIAEDSSMSQDLNTGKLSMDGNMGSRRLLPAAELARLNTISDNGNAIVTMIGSYPLRSKMTPSYLCPKYQIGMPQDKKNTKKKHTKNVKASAIALGFLAASAAALALPMASVHASSLSYEGELPADSFLMEEGEKETDETIVKISQSIYFDVENSEYIYRVANGEGTVRANVMDGMMVRESVWASPDKNVDLSLYCDGSRIEDPDWNSIRMPGDYVVTAACGTVKDETVLSFSVLSEQTGRYAVYVAPKSFRIKKATLDKKKLKLKNKRLLPMELEGDYSIQCKSKKTGDSYTVYVTVDHTPPVVEFSGIDEDGMARKGSVQITSYNKKDAIEVYHNGEKIDFRPEGYYETGAYQFDVMDAAGNKTVYEFTILAYYGNSIRNLALIFAAIFIAIVGYLIYERKRFRVR